MPNNRLCRPGPRSSLSRRRYRRTDCAGGFVSWGPVEPIGATDEDGRVSLPVAKKHVLRSVCVFRAQVVGGRSENHIAAVGANGAAARSGNYSLGTASTIYQFQAAAADSLVAAVARTAQTTTQSRGDHAERLLRGATESSLGSVGVVAARHYAR